MTIKGLTIFVLIISPSFAAEQMKVRCQVDKIINPEKKKEVPVIIVKGAELVKSMNIFFEGHKFSATLNNGNKYETQNLLVMKFNDLESSMYNIEKKTTNAPLNVLIKSDVRFQCWIE